MAELFRIDTRQKEKKQILVVFGSPHKEGRTRKMLLAFLGEFLPFAAWEIHEINAYQLAAHPCTDCKLCGTKEGCLYDDLNEFDEKLRQCAVLVWATPIYHSSFPAPLKAILDRMQRYYSARFVLKKKPPISKHRKAVLLLTMGSEEIFGSLVAQYQMNRAFSVMNTELAGCITWSNTDSGEESPIETMIAVRALARRIANALVPQIHSR